MKILYQNKTVIALLSLLISIVPTSVTFAYPPDNAALPYYRACLYYQPDGEIKKAISDFVKNNIELNDQIKQFVEQEQDMVELVLIASDIPNCDWGLDMSKGLSAPMPPLACMRGLSRLVIADAKIRALQGDYKTALDQALSVKKMSRHVSDKTLVSNLVCYSLKTSAALCIRDVLSDMAEDVETLQWLKVELVNLSTEHPSIQSAFAAETKICTQDFRIEKTDEILNMISDCDMTEGNIWLELFQNRIRNADEAFYQRNKTYYMELTANIIAVLDASEDYAENIARLKDIAETPTTEAKQNPDATLAAVFIPALSKVYNLSVRSKTLSNATRAAVDLYIIKTKTGKLPDEIPQGLPKDMFSGQDFEYVKTSDGFILRCKAQDLISNKVHEYHFRTIK